MKKFILLTSAFLTATLVIGFTQQPAPVKVKEGLLQGTIENGLMVYIGFRNF